MPETVVRLILVLAVLGVVAVAVTVMRMRARSSSRRVSQPDLEAGVYLFTSATCLDCERAREVVLTRFGPSGFTELAWEQSPEVFARLSIDKVPSTLLVEETGSARLWEGQPDEMISAVDP